jgi:hypothetical protein
MRLVHKCARDAEIKTNNCKEGSVRCNFTRRSDSGVPTGDEDRESSDLELEQCDKAEKGWFVERANPVGPCL